MAEKARQAELRREFPLGTASPSGLAVGSMSWKKERPPLVLLWFTRYGDRGVIECGDLGEAIGMAWGMTDNGSAVDLAIEIVRGPGQSERIDPTTTIEWASYERAEAEAARRAERPRTHVRVDGCSIDSYAEPSIAETAAERLRPWLGERVTWGM